MIPDPSPSLPTPEDVQGIRERWPVLDSTDQAVRDVVTLLTALESLQRELALVQAELAERRDYDGPRAIAYDRACVRYGITPENGGVLGYLERLTAEVQEARQQMGAGSTPRGEGLDGC